MYDLFKYFTFINLCLIGVHAMRPKLIIVNLHLTTLVTCLYGIYIAYHKNELRIRLQSIGLDVVFMDWWLKIADFLFHLLPFLYVWSQLEFEGQHIMLTMLIMSIYYALVDVKRIYDIDNERHFKLILLLVCALFIIRCVINRHAC